MTVTVLPGDDAEARVWATALEVSRLFTGIPWVLVDAQMVMLLEREAGRPSGRTTGDVDAIVDVRAVAGALRASAGFLVAAGFEASDPRHPYRFTRGVSQVDLLAPDHLGPRADLTTIPPTATTSIPGGTRALRAARPVDVDVVGVGKGALPAPTLAAAIVLKVRAWEDRQTKRDAEDLVRLLSLVSDVEKVRSDLQTKERTALARVGPLADTRSSAWRVAADPEDARLAFARITV